MRTQHLVYHRPLAVSGVSPVSFSLGDIASGDVAEAEGAIGPAGIFVQGVERDDDDAEGLGRLGLKTQSLLALLAASEEDWYSYSVDGAESPNVEPIEHCEDEDQADGLCCLESGDEYRPWSSGSPLGGAL